MDLMDLRKNFLREYCDAKLIIECTDRVADFSLTKEILAVLKEWLDEELRITDNKPGLVKAKTKNSLDLANSGLFLQEKTKMFDFGRYNYLEGSNRKVNQLYLELAAIIPIGKVEADYPKFECDRMGIMRFLTKEESYHDFQINELFCYCNGFAVAKFRGYLKELKKGKHIGIIRAKSKQTSDIAKHQEIENLQTLDEGIIKVSPFINRETVDSTAVETKEVEHIKQLDEETFEIPAFTNGESIDTTTAENKEIKSIRLLVGETHENSPLKNREPGDSSKAGDQEAEDIMTLESLFIDIKQFEKSINALKEIRAINSKCSNIIGSKLKGAIRVWVHILKDKGQLIYISDIDLTIRLNRQFCGLNLSEKTDGRTLRSTGRTASNKFKSKLISLL